MVSGILEAMRELLPDVRNATGLPPWLIADEEVHHILKQLSDEAIKPLMMPGDAELKEGDVATVRNAPAEARQLAMRVWADSHHLRDVLWTLAELVHTVNGMDKFSVEPVLVKRSLPVLVMACFFLGGETMLGQLASAVGADPQKPDTAIDAYRKAISRGEHARLARLVSLVEADPVWSSWVKEFLKTGERLEVKRRNRPGSPTGLAVEALAKMLLEVDNAGRDNPEETGAEETARGGGATPST